MISRLKKKSSSPAGSIVLAWHPNFRDFEKLPDVKVVRTAFFINGTAIVMLVAVAAFFGVQEWQLHGLRSQTLETERQISRDKKPSDQQLALYKKFQAEEDRVREIQAFADGKPSVADILMRLARTLPPNIALNSFDLRESGLILRLVVRGSPEDAAGYATSYLDQLRADQTLTAFDHDHFEFTSQARDAASGRLTVEFLLRFKAPPKHR